MRHRVRRQRGRGVAVRSKGLGRIVEGSSQPVVLARQSSARSGRVEAVQLVIFRQVEAGAGRAILLRATPLRESRHYQTLQRRRLEATIDRRPVHQGFRLRTRLQSAHPLLTTEELAGNGPFLQLLASHHGPYDTILILRQSHFLGFPFLSNVACPRCPQWNIELQLLAEIILRLLLVLVCACVPKLDPDTVNQLGPGSLGVA